MLAGLVLLVGLLGSAAGCSDSGTAGPSVATAPTTAPATTTRDDPRTLPEITMAAWPRLLAAPMEFQGRSVRGIVGRVFSVQRDGGRLAIQMWTSRDFTDGNTLVAVDEVAVISPLTDGDYVRVQGVAEGTLTGRNASGDPVTTPVLFARVVREIDAPTAFFSSEPAIAATPIRISQRRGDLVVTVRRMERTASGGRLEVRATNFGDTPVILSAIGAAIVQQGVRREADLSFELPGFPPQVGPGKQARAVLRFAGVRSGPARFVLDWLMRDAATPTAPFDIPLQVR